MKKIKGRAKQREVIMGMKEYIAGEEFSQSLVCARLNQAASVASIRLRELEKDSKIKKMRKGTVITWKRLTSTGKWLSKAWV